MLDSFHNKEFTNMESSISENLIQLKNPLPDNVVLVAVSKTKPVKDIKAAYEVGQRDFGENRIQEMAVKYRQLPKDIRWHMIGHVQSNKIKYMTSFVHLVHSIDKPKRIEELDKEVSKNNRVVDSLIQINIAEEKSKFGFDHEGAWKFLNTFAPEKFPNVRIRGLMGIATLTNNNSQVRNEFKGLKQFFDRVKSELNFTHFNILSMGMSDDYQLALEEGSTMVRIGSAIFGKRN